MRVLLAMIALGLGGCTTVLGMEELSRLGDAAPDATASDTTPIDTAEPDRDTTVVEIDTSLEDTSMVADTAPTPDPWVSTSCIELGCDAKFVPGGVFRMGRANVGEEDDACRDWSTPYCLPEEIPEHDVEVADFFLDTYEVTVARFKKFVDGYPGSKPAAGAGEIAGVANSGWQLSWNTNLPADQNALKTSLSCFGTATFRADSNNDNKPINCVDWYVAFAFCVWEGGRLPTEAEWEYAAAGGIENRVVPWGSEIPKIDRAIFGCLTTGGTCVITDSSNISEVGGRLNGAGKWGHQDLAGNLWEWTFDLYAGYTTAKCVHPCVVATSTKIERMHRGGDFNDAAGGMRSARRANGDPAVRGGTIGLRCAKSAN
jgi:formylglycine-generating enzyme